MDPVTQGALGAVLPQSTARRGAIALAGLFGFAAGMAADLDVLIQSASDPLLYLEYHRQFTHSLVFIPVGGLIAATVLHFLVGRRWRLPFSKAVIFCTLGYGTHGLLDFVTSYGTMLFWPFSETRYAASIVSVVDPLVTLPVLALVILAGVRKSPVFARVALGWVAVYLGLGLMQHNAARAMAQDLAEQRGHEAENVVVKPSFANILVWKTIYETADRFHVDAVRAGVRPKVFAGTSIAKLDTARDFPWLVPGSRQYNDVRRFSTYSQNYVAKDPLNPDRIIDIRYSFLPNEINALWSIELTPGAMPDTPVRFKTDRGDPHAGMKALWGLITAEPNTLE